MEETVVIPYENYTTTKMPVIPVNQEVGIIGQNKGSMGMQLHVAKRGNSNEKIIDGETVDNWPWETDDATMIVLDAVTFG